MAEHPLPLGDAHQPLRELVRTAIRTRIIEGTLAPGQRIIEREFAQELQVSRLPIREAVRMLEKEGFVTVLPRRGAVVRQLNLTDIEELFDVREALEVLAARRAAEHASEAEVRQLEKTLREAAEATSNRRRAKEFEHRERFHDQIIAMAHNTLLAGLLEPLQDRLHWLFRQTDDPDSLLEEHRALYEAVATRDADAAGAEALAHVRRNRRRLLQSIANTSNSDTALTADPCLS